MDLTTSKCTLNPLPGQQDILSHAIITTHNNIVELNDSNGAPTPCVAKKVHVPRKNGTHHHYKRLSDGIHWDEDLMNECADRFVETIQGVKVLFWNIRSLYNKIDSVRSATQ